MKTIPLTQGKQALVDDDCFERISLFKWRACKKIYRSRINFYAVRWACDGILIHMHRCILGDVGSHQIDHINGDGLDNRRENLRPASISENHHNRRKWIGTSSQFKGVYWNKSRQKWESRITLSTGLKFIGRFLKEEDAAKKYDDFAKLHFGEFARLNFTVNP